MKNTLTLFAILLASVVTGQNTIEKTIGEFQKLKVYDLIEVQLVKSKENKVVISGHNADDVVVINKNGKLKIRMKLEESFDGKNTTVTLYYTSIDVLDANEGAIITSKNKIKQFEIELKAQEGAKINVNLKVQIANIKSVSGGVIETAGKALKQEISINTGGVYKGKDLKTETTKILISAAGEADVNASELVDVRIRAGGDVYIYGNPKTVNKSRVIGGRIKRMNQ
jgi:Putative auto-transporter adhesin, head GIN domain